MEFELEGYNYRLARGVGTNMWLLLVNSDDQRSWRLIANFDREVPDEDIKDYAIVAIRQGRVNLD